MHCALADALAKLMQSMIDTCTVERIELKDYGLYRKVPEKRPPK
jgi:hypothetical protein